AAQGGFEGNRFAEQANSMQTVAGLMGLVTKPYIPTKNKGAVDTSFRTLFESQQPPTGTVRVVLRLALTAQPAWRGQPQCGGTDKLRRGQQTDIPVRAIQQGGVVKKEATVGSKPYYVVTGPLLRSDGKRIGAVMISQEQTLGATQEQVAKTIFLGALAATLFA